MEDEKVEEEVRSKIVFSSSVARKLLKMGYNIIDIKPKKENTEMTNFVFKVERNFLNDFYRLLKKGKKGGKNNE